MNRRQFIVTLGGAMGAAADLAARAVYAQQSGKPRRIGFLAPMYPSHPAALSGREFFVDALRKLGHEEGRNLQIEWRYAEFKPERFAPLANELAGLDLDVIVAIGNVASFAAKRATRTVPIVVASANAVEYGLVDNFARPSGNLTGTEWWSFELAEKQYQLLKDAVPHATRAARIWYPSAHELYGEAHLQRIQAVTGLTVTTASIARAEDLSGAFERVVASRAEVLYVHGFELVAPNYPAIATFAAERKLVSISEHPNYTVSGGLLHYSVDGPALSGRMASQIDRILRGAKPGDIPVERPTRFELVLNNRTAKAMGVTLSRAFMAQVSRVIE
jgi:putative ABC transport system substrate-binding protein